MNLAQTMQGTGPTPGLVPIRLRASQVSAKASKPFSRAAAKKWPALGAKVSPRRALQCGAMRKDESEDDKKRWRQPATRKVANPATVTTDQLDGVVRADVPYGASNNAVPSFGLDALGKPLTDDEIAAAKPGRKFMSKDVSAIILAGGGTASDPLTRGRARGAVPLGGSYRLVDVPVSNCINSGIDRVFVMTQWNSTSLNQHLLHAYPTSLFGTQHVESLSACVTPEDSGWFRGSADAVRRNLGRIEADDHNPEVTAKHYLICPAEALYRMDYRDLLATHKASGAAITISCVTTNAQRGGKLGVCSTDRGGTMRAFVEKPALGEQAEADRWAGKSPWATEEQPYLASMGVYVFDAEALHELLLNPETHFGTPVGRDHHFGRDVIPHALRAGYKVQCHHFTDYWRDVANIKDYYEVNLAFAENPAPFSMYDADFPMFTTSRALPPSRVTNCELEEALISDGCRISGATIRHSVLGSCMVVEEGTRIESALLMGTDFIRSEAQRAEDRAAGIISVGVGRNCIISNAIIDRNVSIGDNCQIVNASKVVECDCTELGYVITNGIVTVLKGTTLPSGTII
mmetsp:Transcript_17355/g.55731  ORF Transcript_17355/g.55731 Transcript_17355/m.55731 type:complete len:575 (-) Transcript_17355:25-1749(-)|eukprot:CAMPEP_0182867504 /NCGR_PEP_ID=MMETSP0034_2-20130328/8747_1 /TAXON_ID=156128 /ORGANISM="Nephroselmis pyriformis, Strain CCMP717" /LENGTH=574 /DNA_ID=CAMNT_0024999863 /DNA_START=155 /DNA_END=1879 /DNA_ORIENTATION=-